MCRGNFADDVGSVDEASCTSAALSGAFKKLLGPSECNMLFLNSLFQIAVLGKRSFWDGRLLDKPQAVRLLAHGVRRRAGVREYLS